MKFIDIDNENNALDNDASTKSPQASYLAEDIKIEGDIITNGDLRFHGSVNGNITCDGNLIINGQVKGDMKALQVMIQSESVQGNITCEKDCDVFVNSEVKGNINAYSVIVDGCVKGDINAQDKTYLGKQATIKGNCSTRRIIIEDGAQMKGRLNTKENT